MSKLFTHAGYSKLNGQYKARFANDALRVKVLEKSGHEDIQITGLMKPSTKEEAVEALLKADFAKGNPAAQAALEAEMDKRTDKPKAVKATAKPAKAKAPAKSKEITLDSIMSKVVKAPKAPAVRSESEKTKAQIQAELSDLEDAAY